MSVKHHLLRGEEHTYRRGSCCRLGTAVGGGNGHGMGARGQVHGEGGDSPCCGELPRNRRDVRAIVNTEECVASSIETSASSGELSGRG